MSTKTPDPLEFYLQRLYRRSERVVKLGLDATRNLLDELGNPQNAMICVHVAGTNGKGSVCAMVASILQAAGFRTGLYTSPHLLKYNERVRVNGVAISDADLRTLLEDVDVASQRAMKRPGGRDVTFFEFGTGVAFEYFKRQGVHFAVIETGMGGRLDATNVITPAVSVITSIGMDHMEHLGDTLEAIAIEKAGIIKPGCPVVVGDLPSEAMDVVKDAARTCKAQVILAKDAATVWRKHQTWSGQRLKVETEDGHYGPLNLPLVGCHQLANTALAVSAIEVLRERLGIAIPKQAVEKGLEHVQWPGRFQLIGMEPPMVIDGAHNPHAARSLRLSLEELADGRGLGLIAGFLSDKDAGGYLKEMAPLVRRCWIVQIDHDRAMPLSFELQQAHAAGIEAVPVKFSEAVEDAKRWATAHNGMICISGSLYLAGEALRFFDKTV